MKVLFDHQTFSLQNYGGISRYHAELISGINNTNGTQAYLSVLFSNNIHLKDCGLKVKSFSPEYTFKGKGKFIYYFNQLSSISNLSLKRYDIFHATYYDPYFIPFLKGRPFVITFHDMIYEKFSTNYSGLAIDTKIIENKKLIAEKASRIIAVSESTKKDVVSILGIDPEKIQVIYHGSSLPVQKEIKLSYAQPYLLFVGNRYMYKNFSGLLNAIHILLKKYDIKLLCVGGGEFTIIEKETIKSLNILGYVEQHNFNDYTLPTYYQNALAFIFPTFYEGFGIPILEAFACGCPCIVSNVSSLPEVAGDAAVYIDPTIPTSITCAVEQIINDSNLRATLVEKGRNRITHFSWQRTVAETLKLYQEMV